MAKWKIRCLGLLPTILICLAMVSCGQIERTVTAVEEAVAKIDQALLALDYNSQDWQNIVQNLAKNLPKELQSTIRNEVQQVATRTIAQAGIEFRANADFLAARVKLHLQQIKAKLLNQPAPRILPSFVSVDPVIVDLNLSAERRASVLIFGYDLDVPDESGKLFTIYLENSSGNIVGQLSESLIVRTTHYQVSLQTQDASFAQLLKDKKVVKLRIARNERVDGLPEIGVSQPTPPEDQTFNRAVGAITHVPRHVRGDRDFDVDGDEPSDMRVIGETRVRAQAVVEARVFMWVKERESDYTTVESWSNEKQVGLRDETISIRGMTLKIKRPVFAQKEWQHVYTAPEGWIISKVTPIGLSEHAQAVTDHRVIEVDKAAEEVVRHFTAYIDQSGDEAGSYTRVQAKFAPITITIKKQ